MPPDNYYHIMNRGNNHMPIFTCDEDYSFYLKKFAELKLEHPFDLCHYCLMGTHIHLLVKLDKGSDFSNFSKRLNLSYSSYYQRNYGFSGHFWQGRFKSQLISNDPYFIQCGKYIELNPVKANIVADPEDYPWSSYNFYSQGNKDPLITEDVFYLEMGQSEEEKRRRYEKMVVDTIIEQFMDKNDMIAIGNSRFIYNSNRRAKYHINHPKAPYRKRGS